MGHCLRLLCWLTAFGLCNLGYWELFRRKLRIDPAYFPSLTVVLTISILYLAGILNFLREASWGLWLTGFFYLGNRIRQERSVRFLKFYGKPVFIMLVFFTVASFVGCYGKVLLEYDNFTHWGLVAKQMVTEHHFPDYRDPVIMFQAYPLGTATYLYFGLSFLGMGMAEDMAMFLQTYMILCFEAALFSRAKKNMAAVSAFMAIAMLFFVSISLGILDLRVDVVLGVAAGCTLLYVNDHCLKETGTKESWLGACYMVALSQIKNSAMLMVLICSAGILWNGKSARNNVQRLLLAASPVAAWFLWRKHYGNVYTSAENSYHAMTLSNYKRTFFDNPIGKIGQIAMELLRFAFTFRKTIACAVCFMLVAVLILWVWKKGRRLLRRAAIFGACFYGVYMFFLLAMYIFSMGTIESEGLPSAVRYTNTALAVINYVLFSLCVREISQANLADKRQTVCVVALLMLLPCRMWLCGEKLLFVRYGPQEDPVRQEMNRLIQEENIPSNSQHCILVPKGDNGLLHFKLRYSLMSASVRQLENAGKEALESITEPYVFVYDLENPAVQTWLVQEKDSSTVILIPGKLAQ